MKKAEHSFLMLVLCLVAAMFIGLTVLACGKTADANLAGQPKTITLNNTSIYDLTDLHFTCNNDASLEAELASVKSGSSASVELPENGVYSIQVSGKAANGKTFSSTFAGVIDNSSSVTVSLDEYANISLISNIVD